MASATAGALRRLAAAGYDGLLLLALLMLVTALLQLLTRGAAITPAGSGVYAYLYRVLLAACVVAYVGICWTRRGQTLGMKAWRLRLERADGSLPGWRTVAARLALSAPLHLLAIAALLMFIAQQIGWPVLAACLAPLSGAYGVRRGAARGTLVDRLSRTQVIRLPAPVRTG